MGTLASSCSVSLELRWSFGERADRHRPHGRARRDRWNALDRLASVSTDDGGNHARAIAALAPAHPGTRLGNDRPRFETAREDALADLAGRHVLTPANHRFVIH